MPNPKCFPSSSIGLNADISHNFRSWDETVSISWDDAFRHGSLTNDTAWFRVLHLCEPPDFLDVIDDVIKIHKYYDLILTWNDKILEKCKNARFLTESCCSWIDKKRGGTPQPLQHYFEGYGKAPISPIVANYIPCDVSAKRFEVSYLTTSKGMCAGHALRQKIYEALPESFGELKVWKHRSPPRIDDKRSMVDPVQFMIAPENSQNNGYYSEKLVDCFVAKTFPLYWGCTSLDRYFDPAGYMCFSDVPDLLQKLQSLTPDFYASRLDAIEHNYKVALQSVHQWDLVEQYISEGIVKKYIEKTEHENAVKSIEVSRSVRTLHRPLRRIQ